ncbi:MAG: HAD family hydrolase, partial [Halobacteriaceae archaeon]
MDPQYKGYVYDLDGTVIRLPVNWSTVEQKLAEIIASSQYNATNYDAWELLEICENIGRRTEALKYIRKHEVKSAPDAVKLPLAETLSSHNTPVGICSL